MPYGTVSLRDLPFPFTQFEESTEMLKRREGFTLIELLIVIVIIGILAAIAIPKFGATRDKAYFKAMMSDLRNLQAQQELYYSDPANNYEYAANMTDLPDVEPSAGVTLSIAASSATGWSATAEHAALTDALNICAVFVGDAAAVTPATTPGVVA
ncbi:MAG: prepilin-type N-terminal cleavage/methylation domain-containing protein, partial [Longimicrobiales bacterium]